MYAVKMIEDSISPAGVRISTLQLTYPRFVHAEFMTHRVFSRNASSSRAIPTAKLIENSMRDMVLPIRWGRNQPGMQASEQDLPQADAEEAERIWLWMAQQCAHGVKELTDLGLHKQWCNRPLEWFGNITVVVTATEWDNWFELRDHNMAQPEIHHLASMMRVCMDNSQPKELAVGEWHLPYITEDEKASYTNDTLLKMSTARCARVSYLTQEGNVPSMSKDLELYDRLVGSVPLHASPCEHQAQCTDDPNAYWGNFRSWLQHRKLLEESFK